MTSSRQLEREAERTRSQLAQTLDELRERITPGQLVDQAIDYARDSGGGMFVRNLGRQTTANPLPVALIGAGIAWLALSNGRQSTKAASINRAAEAAVNTARRAMTNTELGESSRKAASEIGQFGDEASERVSDWVADYAGRVTDGQERFREMAETARTTAGDSAKEATSRAGDTISSLSETASSTFETAKSRTAETYGQIADQAKQATSDMGNAVSGLGQRTAGATKDLLQFCKTQPLVLAGLGLALGAIVGALIPPTETEDALMGETSDQVKDQAREVAEEQYEKAKESVKSGFDQAEAPEHPETSLVPGAEPSAANEPVERADERH
jgi:ElaB/YqjD/DUF883 family membrane-anchored ribosome-binding protein